MEKINDKNIRFKIVIFLLLKNTYAAAMVSNTNGMSTTCPCKSRQRKNKEETRES